MSSISRAAVQLFAALFLAAVFAPPAQAAEAPPIDAFFRHPALASAQLSPSGELLAVLAPAADGRVLLAVVDLNRNDKMQIAVHFNDADVHSFEWVNDKRLVFDTTDFQLAG